MLFEKEAERAHADKHVLDCRGRRLGHHNLARIGLAIGQTEQGAEVSTEHDGRKLPYGCVNGNVEEQHLSLFSQLKAERAFYCGRV